MNTYYVYFAAGQRTSSGLNLYTCYSKIVNDTPEEAKARLKTYFPDVKAYVSTDGSSVTKYGMKYIPLNYELQLKKNEQ